MTCPQTSVTLFHNHQLLCTVKSAIHMYHRMIKDSICSTMRCIVSRFHSKWCTGWLSTGFVIAYSISWRIVCTYQYLVYHRWHLAHTASYVVQQSHIGPCFCVRQEDNGGLIDVLHCLTFEGCKIWCLILLDLLKAAEKSSSPTHERHHTDVWSIDVKQSVSINWQTLWTSWRSFIRRTWKWKLTIGLAFKAAPAILSHNNLTPSKGTSENQLDWQDCGWI